MAKKRTTLLKNFEELIEAQDIDGLKKVFEKCEIEARGGYSKKTALSFVELPEEVARWLVEEGADINAKDEDGKAPIHHHAGHYAGNIELMLELGADIECKEKYDDTPIHTAAEAFLPENVSTLIKCGADVNAVNSSGLTPLFSAIYECQNVDIADMAKIADLLIEAGAKITVDMKSMVEKIGETFEHYKADFSKDMLDETVEGLNRLYEIFDVTPVPEREIKEVTPLTEITVNSKDWEDQHDELWEMLVPNTGHANTVQGEVIRITGKVAREVLDNGGINWDRQFSKMLKTLPKYFAMGTAPDKELINESKKLVKDLKGGQGQDEPARLCELAVKWVLANPEPMMIESVEYDR